MSWVPVPLSHVLRMMPSGSTTIDMLVISGRGRPLPLSPPPPLLSAPLPRWPLLVESFLPSRWRQTAAGLVWRCCTAIMTPFTSFAVIFMYRTTKPIGAIFLQGTFLIFMCIVTVLYRWHIVGRPVDLLLHLLDRLRLNLPPSLPTPPAPSPGRPSPNIRNLECDIRLLMEHYLGRRFPSFGKAVVMDIATKSVPPKFSK